MIKSIEDVGMSYSIGADSDLSEEMEKVAAADYGQFITKLGLGRAYAKMGAILNKWYCEEHGGEPVTEKEFLTLPAGAYQDLEKKILDTMTEGQKTSVELKPAKKGKAAGK